jgi:hypothetical protein
MVAMSANCFMSGTSANGQPATPALAAEAPLERHDYWVMESTTGRLA